MLFNSLLLILPIFAAHIVVSAYTSDIATDPLGLDARTETRERIEEELAALAPLPDRARDAWAQRIEVTLNERDFSAARGYLLAAPLMLDRKDAQAVEAAAEAERAGTRDQRLARAALLFLPDNVRAAYQRAIAPPVLNDPPEVIAEGDVAAAAAQQVDPVEATDALASEGQLTGDTVTEDDPQILYDPLKTRRAISLIGDRTDLTRRSQRWLLGESRDTLTLRLAALGLILREDGTERSEAFAEAASILTAAHRAGRLEARFSRYILSRVEDALPAAPLRDRLSATFEGVRTTEARAEDVVAAFRASVQEEALERLTRDMAIIARLAQLTSSTGALTLVEQATTPEDMRRALLITEAGGERSVALARELGRDVLSLAQIGAQWTWALALQVMALTSLAVALIWVTASALGQADTLRVRSKFG
ncbi:MAG: hypothetical protein AAFO63_00900 [Pseudomonadota bacterium]